MLLNFCLADMKNIKLKIILTLALAAYVLLLWLLPITCPIKALTGINCLGCGMTRAYICLLRLDFSGAFSYHFMFWSVPLLYLAFLKDGRLFNKKYLNVTFYIVIFVGFVINWFFGL